MGNIFSFQMVDTTNKQLITTSTGAPFDDNQNSLTVGPNGPILLQDFNLLDKLAHFARERIPERVVHAKGAAAHGELVVTKDLTGFTRANFLNEVGKKTPCFLRFSTVAGERGANDCDRDPRGFAIKFYTEEGNYDMVGNNTPVFFIKDPIKFPDFIHSQKRHPQTGVQSPEMAWDFWSYSPEALHQVTILMSDRGTPYGYRHMNGYSSHTFKWVNAKGEAHLVKYHFKTDQGIKNFTGKESAEMGMKAKDFATMDLFDAIKNGDFPSWTWFVQIMPFEDAAKCRFDVYDITKVWPHSDYPLQEVGKLTLNRNPDNFHAETEQVAFSPGHFVPGIEASNDKMLQGRLINYPDAHRYRLQANHHHIPINCPYRAKALGCPYNQRDGVMVTNGGGGSSVNYEPSSFGSPVEDKQYAAHGEELVGKVGRYAHQHPNTNYEQPRELFHKVFDDTQRTHCVENIAGGLGQCNKSIQMRMLPHFFLISEEYGSRVGKAIGLSEDDIATCKAEAAAKEQKK